MKKLSEHFTEEECSCNCGCGTMAVQPLVLYRLEIARLASRCPYRITSWTRCYEHNLKVGGTPTSSHVDGFAVDIEAKSNRVRQKVMYGLLYAGFDRIGIGERFIHADCDPQKPSVRLWFY